MNSQYLKRASLWFEKRSICKTFISKSLFTCDCYSVIPITYYLCCIIGCRLFTIIKVWLFERPVNKSWNLFLKICRWSDYHLPRSAQLTNLNKKKLFFLRKKLLELHDPNKEYFIGHSYLVILTLGNMAAGSSRSKERKCQCGFSLEKTKIC